MNLFDLVAKLTLDSSEYDRALMAAKGSAMKAGGGIVSAIDKTKKNIGLAATAMGGAIAAFGVSSVKTGLEFDAAMSQVAATMGKTMDDLKDETGEVDLAWGHFSGTLRDFAQEMGAHTKFSATEAAEALNYMALAGYDAEKSMRMLPNVLSLAAAGNMDLARASDMVTDASSALGLEEERTTQMVDEMAAAASNTNTSVEQLGDAMLRVGGTAKVMNGGIANLSDGTKQAYDGTTELSVALGLLADNGTKGAQAGTAMRNILQSIQGAKFEKTFGEMGISAYDAEGNLRSLRDIIDDMNVAMDGMTQEERTDIISKTFNARDLKNVEALLGTTSERWDEVTESIIKSKGAAEEMASTQLDNLAGDITILKSAFEGLKISVSDKLSPIMRQFVQFLTWCIDNASTLGPIILGLATAFGVFAVAINIGTIIGTMIQNVTKAFAAFNAILMANPIGIVIALIAGLVVAFTTLYKNNEKFRKIVNSVWGSVKAKVTSAVSSIKSAINGLKSVVNSVSQTFNRIKSAISEKIEAAKEKVQNAVNKIKGLFPLSIGKIFSGLKLPHFSVSGGSAPWGIGGKGSLPSFSVSWYKKAMDTPYLFKNPTLFNMSVAGEAGDEVMYGRKALMRDIAEATGGGAQFINYITIEGANSPMETANAVVRQMKLELRTM